jgi:hypothetical protein
VTEIKACDVDVLQYPAWGGAIMEKKDVWKSILRKDKKRKGLEVACVLLS